MDHRVDRQGILVVVSDEFAAAAGQDATDSRRTNGGVEGFIAPEQATELEVENVACVGKGDVVGEGARQTQDRRMSRSGWQGGRRVRRDGNLPKHPWSGRAGVADETTLAHHADAETGVVSRIIGQIGDGPGSDHAPVRGRDRRGEDDTRVIALLAQVRAREINRGVVLPGQAGENKVYGGDGAATRGSGNGISSLGEGQCAKDFAGSGGDASGVSDVTAAKSERCRVPDAVVVLGSQAAVVAQGQRGVIDIDRRGIQERRVILKRGGAAKQSRGAGIGLRLLELNFRITACLDEIQTRP